MLESLQKSNEPSFEEWLGFVFDHPGEGPEWYWDPEAEDLEARLSAPTIVAYLTDLFRGAPSHLAPYSLAQAYRGLRFLASNACSGHFEALGDVAVNAGARLRCIESMTALFRDYFAPRCADVLSHLDEPGANPLNAICYMWWDLLPWWWHGDRALATESIDACVAVMTETLTVDSIAVREGALHGLGHAVSASPEVRARVARVVDDLLDRNDDLRPELRTYALAARSGCVL